ncbi:flagellar hook-basal body complex protein [Sphingomonas sp. VNH70]|uniref:flagellar hook-basal body complex protein n=1 Tax=Sphingomonas silueang TaxID=3156617 RepID=UPI0032B4E9D9
MMFGSIYIGLSGLNAYARGLQQVSNNVSNLNTTGFKSSTVSFRNLYGASGSGGALGGDGGRGDGDGVTLDAAALSFKQGELRGSDRDLDLSVDGNGFMLLQDGTRTAYARTGSFDVDAAGFIVLRGTNYRLATLDAEQRPVALSIDSRRTSPPRATTTVTFGDNLSATATSVSVGDIKVIDATGGTHSWTARFTRDTAAGANAWTVAVSDAKGTAIGSAALRFTGGIADPATSRLTFTDSASGLSVDFDFSGGATSYSAGDTSTLRVTKTDGHVAGTITALAADANGRLELSYSNGEKADLGAIALAGFRDPTRLEQQSGVFVETVPGDRLLLAGGDARVGQVRSRRLEASNVDLSQQFGDLILIQRGFQASSQIVSVSNDMIQQLFGIRGQG